MNVEDDDGESALAAVGCVTALRRILDSCQKNKHLLVQMEDIIYPILVHSLTSQGMDAIEDGVDCLTLLLYYGEHISPKLWALFPQMLYVVCGEDDNGGFGMEYVG